MNKVHSASKSGRCVIVVGGKAVSELSGSEKFAERSGYPWLALSQSNDKIPPIKEGSLSSVTSAEGGLIVIVEPDFLGDGEGFRALDAEIKRAKPKLIVVAKKFNPFLLPSSLRSLKLDHMKLRGRDFLSQLEPVGLEGAVKKKGKEKPAKKRAPQAIFVGREEEQKELEGLIEKGGATVIVGPEGVGKRWLLTKGLSSESIKQLEPCNLSDGADFDTLAARLAEIADNRKILTGQKKNPLHPKDLVHGLVAALGAPELKGTVLPVIGLERILRRDGTIHRDDRLAMLVRALYESESTLSVVFTSTLAPKSYSAESSKLKVLELGGLDVSATKALFESWHVEDISEDQLKSVNSRTCGHPLSLRLFAAAWRDAEKPETLLEKKFLLQRDVGHLDRLRNHIRDLVASVSAEVRQALIVAAHAPAPVPAGLLTHMGVARADRLALLSMGLLDVTAGEGDKYYSVNSVVSNNLTRRESQDFSIFGALADAYSNAAQAWEGDMRLVRAQEANRLYHRARMNRAVRNLGVPDGDGAIESIRGVMRKKHNDLANQKCNELLKYNPLHTEARLLRVEIMSYSKAPAAKVEKSFAEMEQLCPTPEVFHQMATWAQGRKKGGLSRAADALQRGIKLFPENGRLKRRLAGCLIGLSRFDQAEKLLRAAIAQEPNLIDAYGSLAEAVYRRETSPWSEAEKILRDAIAVEPKNVPVLIRLGGLLRHRGMVEADNRVELWAEAKAQLETALSIESRNIRANGEYGVLLVDMARVGHDSDLKAAEEALSVAAKVSSQSDIEVQVSLARVYMRTDRINEASTALGVALKRRANHVVLAGLGELYGFQGQIFRAEKEFRAAWHDAPENAPERHLYKLELAKFEGLIASGAAVDIEKQAEGVEVVAPLETVSHGEAGPRRDPGKTVVRRKSSKSTASAAAETEPKTTEPEAAEPEVTESETVEPEVAEPEVTEPAEKN